MLVILVAAPLLISNVATGDPVPMPELGTFVVANNLEPTSEGCAGSVVVSAAPRPIDQTGKVLVDVLPDCAVSVGWQSVLPTAPFGNPEDVRIYAIALIDSAPPQISQTYTVTTDFDIGSYCATFTGGAVNVPALRPFENQSGTQPQIESCLTFHGAVWDQIASHTAARHRKENSTWVWAFEWMYAGEPAVTIELNSESPFVHPSADPTTSPVHSWGNRENVGVVGHSEVASYLLDLRIEAA